MDSNKVYVAVGEEVEERESTLQWVLKGFKKYTICVIYVHVPAKMITLPSGFELPVHLVRKDELDAFREQELGMVRQMLGDCTKMCALLQVPCETTFVVKDSIIEGILEHIHQLRIEKLVMGAAANHKYQRGMTKLMSEKATKVLQFAPDFCHVWFICKGHLIYKRGMRKLMFEKAKNVLQFAPYFRRIWFIWKDHLFYVRESVMEQSLDTEEMPSNSSEIYNQSDSGILLSEAPLARFRHSVHSGHGRGPANTWQSSTFSHYLPSSAKTLLSDLNSASILPAQSFANEDFTKHDMPQNRNQHQESSINGTLYNQLEQGISEPESSGCEAFREDKQDMVMETAPKGRTWQTKLVKSPCYEELRLKKVMKEEASNMKRSTMGNNVELAWSSVTERESSINGTLYNQFEQAISETESSQCEAHRESAISWNAHRQAMAAIRKAKPVERPYSESLKINKAMKDEVNTKRLLTKLSLKLTEALGHKMSLESQVEKFNLKVKYLEKKRFSEMALSHKYKNECDKLQLGKDSALREARELREHLARGPSTDPIFCEFSYLDLKKATNFFDPSLRIGVGGYVYKGFLHHTQVAIKLLPPNCVPNHLGFEEQVRCLSKLRHANLVTLMGACREPRALVYEHLPGGTLEDRPSLPWQMRIRIAMSICSALIFFRSAQCTGIFLGGIFLGDLSPKKLLLDTNFTCKITDFSLLAYDTISMDDLESDVYSYGIFVLYLLTGKQVSFGIAKEVECALKIGALDSILDPLAGDWPYVQAEQLAHMALRCCELNRNDRPDLASDVWRVLEPMEASCSSLSSFLLASRDQPPHCFTCPIFQEIMEDPHFAADGFTYEAEAIRGWLESGHDTSPMTNKKLANLNLTPNRTLRSAIKEWQQFTSTEWL